MTALMPGDLCEVIRFPTSRDFVFLTVRDGTRVSCKVAVGDTVLVLGEARSSVHIDRVLSGLLNLSQAESARIPVADARRHALPVNVLVASGDSVCSVGWLCDRSLRLIHRPDR